MDILPELLFSHAADPAQSRRVRRLAADGRLHKLYAGVYTSNLEAPAESVVLRHWRAIVGHLLPGGVISHRSAFDGRPQAGKLLVTRGKTRRTLELPGLTVEVLPGPPAVTDGAARDVPYGSLFLASEPRRLLENLGRGRGWSERVLPRQDVEVQLDKMLALRGEHRLNDLRDACRALAGTLGMAAEFARLDGIVGALLGTHVARNVSARQSFKTYRMQNVTLQLDVFNFLNLVNKSWGLQRSSGTSPITLMNATSYNGTILAGQPNYTFNPGFVRYFSNNLASNYQIQLQARYGF